MDGRAHLAELAALYRPRKPDAQELAKDLIGLAEMIHVRLSALHDAPNAPDAERLALGLEGVRYHLLQLADAIRQEGER